MVSYSVEQIPVARIRVFDFQPRKWFDPAEIRARAESMRALGQQDPVTVERVKDDPKFDYELINGESRLRSAIEAGISTLWAAVRSEPFPNRTEKHMASLVANFNRSDHTPMEISDALFIQSTEGKKTQFELATAIGKQQVWVSNYLSLQNLHQDIKPLLHPTTPKNERIAAAVAFELARVPKDRQLDILEAAKAEDGRVTLMRVKLLIEQRGAKTRTRERSPSKKREILTNTLRTLKLSTEKLQAMTEDTELDGEAMAALQDSIRALQSTALTWTPEREARYRALHTPNPEHVAHLREGIRQFRALLEQKYPSK